MESDDMNFFVIRLKTLAAAAAGVLAICAAGVFFFSNASETFLVGGREIPIYSVARDDNRIALTFDCAWNADDIDSILGTLGDHNVKATFFVVGSWAEKYPDAVRKIAAQGHELGSHSYNHADYTTLSESEMLEDMERTDNIIKDLTGESPALFRAPSGSYNSKVVAAAESSGRIYVQWSRDALDYTETATKDSIIKRACENTVPGDIILMHNGTKYTAYALDALLDDLCARFEPVKVSELLHLGEYTVDASGKQFPVTGGGQSS